MSDSLAVDLRPKLRAPELVVDSASVIALPGTEDAAPPAGSDDALALEFAEKHAEELRYSAGLDWLRFDGQRWLPDTRLRRYDAARAICRAAATTHSHNPKAASRLASAGTVSAVISLSRSDPRLNVDADAWDADLRVLNTPEGIVNLMTGDQRKTTPSDLVTKVTAVAPAAGPASVWCKFLADVFEGDGATIEFMRMMLGYCLTGSTKEHKLFFFWGDGSNGKSTLLDLVEWLMGDYALKLPAQVLMHSRTQQHPTELAQLQGRRLATSSEIEDGMY